MKLMNIYSNVLLEIFDTENKYEYNIEEIIPYSSEKGYHADINDPDLKFKVIKFQFKSKDNVSYQVEFTVNFQKNEGKIDFMGSNYGEYNSPSDMLNKHDAIKVFNTIIDIVKKYSEGLKTLIISSNEKRINVYEKMIQYFGLHYEKLFPTLIKVYLNT